MSLKIAKKETVGTVVITVNNDKGEKGTLTEVARFVIYPSNTINEKLLHSLLAEVQRQHPIYNFSGDNGTIIDYIADIDNLGTVAEQQESAIEELRTKNEEQETRIELLEQQLKEAQEASSDWAAKFKKLKGTELELAPSPGTNNEVDNSESAS